MKFMIPESKVPFYPKREQSLELPKIIDERGNLSFIEAEKHIPFKIARTYWIYDVPGGQSRGSHAFREQEEFIVALSGSFEVVLHDGMQERRYTLNRSYNGIYVPPMMWRTLENFSTNAICLVLASGRYEEEDYIRDFKEYQKEMQSVFSKNVRCREYKYASFNYPSQFLESSVYQCNVFELPKIHNPAGNLTALNNIWDIPFDVKRVYYTYDIPSGATRGGHAHRELQQYLLAVSGSFDVLLDDGRNRKIIHLDRPNFALSIIPGIWRELINFSSGAVCLVLASEKFNEDDYIREYTDFFKLKSCR